MKAKVCSSKKNITLVMSKEKFFHWPNFRHWASGWWRFSGLSLHTRGSVHPIFPTFGLGIQWDIWRCVTYLHSCLRCGNDHRWWWYRSYWSLHWYNGCHRGWLSGKGTVRGLTALVRRRVHSCVDRLPGCWLRWQRTHGGVEVPMGLFCGGGEPTLPPWYPA